MISHAAGLSCLHSWRFALAPMAGIIPASFPLAHVGVEPASADMSRATWAVPGLGLATIASALDRGQAASHEADLMADGLQEDI